MTLEVGNHPDAIGAVILHSTESGQFLPCERVEFERLAAAIKRGELDPFLRMEVSSAAADGDADFTRAAPPDYEEMREGLPPPGTEEDT